jgi:hypothetical protein
MHSPNGEHKRDSYYPLTLFFDKKGAFGNFYGCFNAEKEAVRDAESDLINQWQGGYLVSEDDYIEKS